MAICAVCEQEVSTGLNRVGGTDVCDRCYLGDAPNRVRQRGWSLKIKQYDRPINNEGDRIYFTEATLGLPLHAKVYFTCRRRTIGWLLLGWLLPRVKTGDDIFDRHVHVRSSTAKATKIWLSHDGVQSILLDMLGEGSSVTVQPGQIDVFSTRSEYVPETKFSAEICVLASHFSRIQADNSAVSAM